MADLYGSQDVTIRNDDGTVIAAVDADANALSVITAQHYLIHEGKHFFCNNYLSGLSNGVSYDTLFISGTTLETHLRIFGKTLGGGRLEVREAATTSNDGSGLSEYNYNRLSATTPTGTSFNAPTVTGTGTLISTILMGGANGTTDNLINGDYELILLKNTKYLFRFASTSGSNALTLTFNWYEVA